MTCIASFAKCDCDFSADCRRRAVVEISDAAFDAIEGFGVSLLGLAPNIHASFAVLRSERVELHLCGTSLLLPVVAKDGVSPVVLLESLQNRPMSIDDRIRLYERIAGSLTDRTPEKGFDGFTIIDECDPQPEMWHVDNSGWSIVSNQPSSLQRPCPDCKGTGKHVGFTVTEDCATCGGKGLA